jgi:hypothetical protein
MKNTTIFCMPRWANVIDIDYDRDIGIDDFIYPHKDELVRSHLGFAFDNWINICSMVDAKRVPT